MTIQKRLGAVILAGCLAIGCIGCGSSDDTSPDTDETVVYYLNSDENSIYAYSYATVPNEGEEGIEELLHMIRQVPEEEEGSMSVLSDNVEILSTKLEDEVLTIDFSSEYNEMDSTREVLARAAMVRTLLQFEEIHYVIFTVEGEAATDVSGNPIGRMNSDTFVDNAKQINAYQHVAINLYFADSSGKKLQKESRSIYYSSSKPLEWAVVERLIAGPKVDGNYATVSGGTSILSVNNSEETCYVNLSRSFLTDAMGVDEEIAIYSIVNSICDSCKSVKQVQFSIEGDTDVIFRKNMDLSHPYTPNYSYTEIVEANTESVESEVN